MAVSYQPNPTTCLHDGDSSVVSSRNFVEQTHVLSLECYRWSCAKGIAAFVAAVGSVLIILTKCLIHQHTLDDNQAAIDLWHSKFTIYLGISALSSRALHFIFSRTDKKAGVLLLQVASNTIVL